MHINTRFNAIYSVIGSNRFTTLIRSPAGVVFSVTVLCASPILYYVNASVDEPLASSINLLQYKPECRFQVMRLATPEKLCFPK